jgi:hypothetical protein
MADLLGGLAGASEGGQIGSLAGPAGIATGLVGGGIAGSLFGGSQAPSYDQVSQQLANASYANWQEASALIYPNAQQLVQYAEDPNYVAGQGQAADQEAQAQIASQASARARFFQLQGIRPTSRQQEELNQQTGSANADTRISAINTATRQARGLQSAVLTGL